MFDHIKEKSVHFIGIGGIGMSSLARWFKAQNWAVFGSDMAESKITQDLKKEGVKVKIGHKKANLEAKLGLVIYNNAIPEGNPELVEARKRGLPTYSYPEAIGELTRGYETFAVAGAHGKSTTTSLLSLVLMKAGFDPTVIVGTKLKEFNDTNFRLGRKDYLVLEADEWKAAFLNYFPTFVIITNIDKEHLDFYKNFENVEKTFLKFIANMKLGGTLVVNKDNKNLLKIRREIERAAGEKSASVVWYSLADRPDLRSKLKRTLSIPGEHNLMNALAVLMIAKELGIDEKVILSALHDYKGAWRRFEYKGDLNVKKMKIGSVKWRTKAKIPVYDDYAHHPTEIDATLSAFREKFPKHKIICIFEPHQAKRLQNLFSEFSTAFDKADYLVLMPTYKVAGRDKVSKAYTSENLAKKIKRLNKNLNVSFCRDYRKLPAVLGDIITPYSAKATRKGTPPKFVVVMMGAGTIANHTDELV